MKLGTANIQNLPDMPARKVAQDAATIAQHVTLCGLQEIQPGEDPEVIMTSLPGSWWMVGGQHETPIIGDGRRWEVLDHHLIPFHRPKLPRPASSWGAVTSVVLRFRRHPKRPRFAVVNTHLPANGYNGARLERIQDRWRVEWSILTQEVLRLHNRGLTVYVTGDLNNPRPPQLRPVSRSKWLTPSGPPDHIGQVVRSTSVAMVHPETRRVPLNSDHDLIVIRGPLRKAP